MGGYQLQIKDHKLVMYCDNNVMNSSDLQYLSL